MRNKIVLELTPLEANALLRLIGVANTQTLDTEPKDRLAGTWVATRLAKILGDDPLPKRKPSRRRFQRIIDSLGGAK